MDREDRITCKGRICRGFHQPARCQLLDHHLDEIHLGQVGVGQEFVNHNMPECVGYTRIGKPRIAVTRRTGALRMRVVLAEVRPGQDQGGSGSIRCCKPARAVRILDLQQQGIPPITQTQAPGGIGESIGVGPQHTG